MAHRLAENIGTIVLTSLRDGVEEALARVNTLTPRERDVLDLLARGAPNKDIARRLAISARTVEIHRMKVMKKTNARSRVEAALMAFAYQAATADDAAEVCGD